MQNGGVATLLLAQDSTGAVALFGTYAPLAYPEYPQGGTGMPSLFAQKLSSSGSVLYTSDLGQASPDAQATGILLDSAGNSWLSGTDSSAAGELSGEQASARTFCSESTERALSRLPRYAFRAARLRPVRRSAHNNRS
jgi:hypothetical protein